MEKKDTVKKSKIMLFAIIALLIFLALSIRENINLSRDRDMARQYLLNHLHSNFVDISRNLDHMLPGTVADMPVNNEDRQTLSAISDCLIKIDTLLKQHKSFSASEPLHYSPALDFELIAYTIGPGYGVTNGISYNYILRDDMISAAEISYLEALRDDIALMVVEMESPEDPLSNNKDISIAHLNNIIASFFERWSFHNEESPYYLLKANDEGT